MEPHFCMQRQFIRSEYALPKVTDWKRRFNLYPTKDPYAGLLNSSAYPTK
jgi:hypothetical protein